MAARIGNLYGSVVSHQAKNLVKVAPDTSSFFDVFIENGFDLLSVVIMVYVDE